MDKPKFILIGGPPWVGKTTSSRILFGRLNNSAWLDGDDVWRVNPFRVDDPRLRLSDINMAHVLKTYLGADFDYVILSSVVLDEPSIVERILTRLGEADYELVHFSLICDAKTLVVRSQKREGSGEPESRFMQAAMAAKTVKIDTTNMCPDVVAGEMLRHIDPKTSSVKTD